MKIPKYYHIGIPKTGTTTLQYVLKNDDRINLIFSKKYFNSNRYFTFPTYPYFEEGKLNIVSDETISKNNNNTNSIYTFLDRLQRPEPNAIIFLTIREQVDLLKSRYKHAIANDDETNSFTEWLVSKKYINYIDMIMYSNLYKVICAYFPKKNIKILVYEKLKSDFFEYISDLYGILGIEPPVLNQKIIKNKSLSDEEIYEKLLQNIENSNKIQSIEIKKETFLEWDWDKSFWRKLLNEIKTSNDCFIKQSGIDKQLLRKFNYNFH